MLSLLGTMENAANLSTVACHCIFMTKSRHTSRVDLAAATQSRWQTPLAVFLLTILILIVFYGIVSHDFIELDDPDLLYQNPAMYKPLAESLGWNWTHVR